MYQHIINETTKMDSHLWQLFTSFHWYPAQLPASSRPLLLPGSSNPANGYCYLFSLHIFLHPHIVSFCHILLYLAFRYALITILVSWLDNHWTVGSPTTFQSRPTRVILQSRTTPVFILPSQIISKLSFNLKWSHLSYHLLAVQPLFCILRKIS